jgi:hypothetical protein
MKYLDAEDPDILIFTETKFAQGKPDLQYLKTKFKVDCGQFNWPIVSLRASTVSVLGHRPASRTRYTRLVTPIVWGAEIPRHHSWHRDIVKNKTFGHCGDWPTDMDPECV